LQTPVTVSSFYMDETEVTNQHWLDYLRWLEMVFADSYPELIGRALPDTNCWRQKDQDMEKYVELYLRHPAYKDYPVVGVSWLQANDYCSWRTDRVNEQILVREGFLAHNLAAQGADEHFTTETYYNGQYEGEQLGEGLPNYNPKGDPFRKVRMEDGILLPRYRLPNEAEWEYAAMALIGNSYQELITDRRTYPWNGHYVRNGDNGTEYFGTMRANFMRGTGDAMGVAGYLNDNADITAPVYQYPPNDFGLYNMAGNVSEWVSDVYRPLTDDDRSEFRPFRGNVYKTKTVNSDGSVADKLTYNVYDVDEVKKYLESLQDSSLITRSKYGEKDIQVLDQSLVKISQAIEKRDQRREEESMAIMDEIMELIRSSEADIAYTMVDNIENFIVSTSGRQKMRNVSLEENINRTNYRKADNIDFNDGDFQSSSKYLDADFENRADRMYDYGKTTLVNNRSRVYKGGSWEDRVYYNIPSTRRFMDERKSSRSLGFRCAMDRVGSPSGIGAKGEQ
jgi:formylglycine-generating enzyme required for sulfatase activity